MPVNSTHLDYKANAPERSRARCVGGVKRFAQTIFSRVFRAIPPAFAYIRKGFVGQAVCRKTRASVSLMSGLSTLNQIKYAYTRDCPTFHPTSRPGLDLLLPDCRTQRLR